MFGKILIANRGEIACRVIRTARAMGIRTAAVYSEPDKRSVHVEQADEAICIGPAPAAQSYLNIDAIIDACRQCGAEAIHPGYGFLSEDTTFCNRLTKEGIKFIGPGHEAIEFMGDKIASKKLARSANVNVIPGFDDFIEDPDHAVSLANQIGYPVMLKPTSAGGGKGMRLAFNDDECREGFERSRSEAKTHFGDDRVFVEKFIENPRHIEVQVLADEHGNVIHLGERECSLQRRHQKVIEEAPSPFLDEATRLSITGQAVALARAVNYSSAGTVEFVMDADRNYYFLEMNTRLQVEHPVTELVTGIDLVEWMIRIANGEQLDLDQSSIRTTGWSVEARIYAEDPARNFLPSTGRLLLYRPPSENESVRIDSGIKEGSEISVHYDPIVAKLVTYGDDRRQAYDAMVNALDHYQIRGIASNIPFLQRLIRHPDVLAGNITTHFIEEQFPNGHDAKAVPDEPLQGCAAVATVLDHVVYHQAASISGQYRSKKIRKKVAGAVLINGKHLDYRLRANSAACHVSLDNREIVVRHSWAPGQSIFSGTLNDEPILMQVARNALSYEIEYIGFHASAKVLTSRAAEYQKYMLEKDTAVNSQVLQSPMPGLLVEILVETGQQVMTGDSVAVVEAMKMQNVLRTQQDATVAEVLAEVGDSLAMDQAIMRFE